MCLYLTVAGTSLIAGHVLPATCNHKPVGTAVMNRVIQLDTYDRAAIVIQTPFSKGAKPCCGFAGKNPNLLCAATMLKARTLAH